MYYNSEQFQENNIVCNQCISNEFVVEQLYNTQDFCINIPTVENCAVYDKSERLIDSSFKCLECLEGHKLVENQCIFISDRD